MSKPNTTTKIFTLRDARAERQYQEDRAMRQVKETRSDKQARLQREAWAAVMGMDKRIGVLCRNGMPVCYTVIEGIMAEGTRQRIEAILAEYDEATN
jgi:hypothetical protein